VYILILGEECWQWLGGCRRGGGCKFTSIASERVVVVVKAAVEHAEARHWEVEDISQHGCQVRYTS